MRTKSQSMKWTIIAIVAGLMAGFCTWYMEKYAGACDEVHLPKVSAVAAKELKPFGFEFIQIDDQWQEGIADNGPKKNFTTHASNGPYPSGMKKTADNISKLGLVPGIWFMPFAGNFKDPFFKDHQDWFAKDSKGKPYDTAWGGTCLDMTNPATQDYVRSIVHRISNDWGYRFFKMDGYSTGSAVRPAYVNDGYVVALYNWSDRTDDISIRTDCIGLPPASGYVAFDFWADKFISPFRDTITASLPGNSCRILAVRPVADVPQLLSTSRHVTQGIVDVTGENWDAAKSALSGTSKVVENDRYELRVVLPVGAKSWRATAVSVSVEYAAAGVKVTFQHDGPKLRVVLTSPVSREVKWTVSFEPAKIEVTPPPAVTQLKAAADFHGVNLTWADDQADVYRIERNDGVVFNSNVNSFRDTSARNGTTYHYRVTALGWNGIASPAVTVEIITSQTPERPATPPAPTIHLGDLKATQVKNGWGEPVPNKSIGGGPLLIDGKTYAKGIGAHANAISVYPIPKDARRFVAVVGIDDSQKTDPRSSVVFLVFGDVKEMGEKPVLIAKSPVLSDMSLRTWAFNLELNTRFKELHLVVTDAGDGNAADHADWVDAGFIIGTEN